MYFPFVFTLCAPPPPPFSFFSPFSFHHFLHFSSLPRFSGTIFPLFTPPPALRGASLPLFSLSLPPPPAPPASLAAVSVFTPSLPLISLKLAPRVSPSLSPLGKGKRGREGGLDFEKVERRRRGKKCLIIFIAGGYMGAPKSSPRYLFFLSFRQTAFAIPTYRKYHAARGRHKNSEQTKNRREPEWNFLIFSLHFYLPNNAN